MGFISKKGLDFRDFKLICSIIYGGGYKDKTINTLLLKLIETMNNNRLSNSKQPKSEITDHEIALLNNVSSAYEYLSDGSIIEIKTGRVVSINSIYLITLVSGKEKIFANREEVARELGVSLSTVSNKLNLHREGVKIKDSFVKRVKVFGASVIST